MLYIILLSFPIVLFKIKLQKSNKGKNTRNLILNTGDGHMIS